MKQPSIHIPVQISAAEFRAFALFDTFRHKQQWRRPAVFLLIMGVSAALCYSRYPQEGALLLGTILLVLGLAERDGRLKLSVLGLAADAPQI